MDRGQRAPDALISLGNAAAIHPAAERLACHLVKEEFGDLCECVFRALIHKNAVKFADLQRSLGELDSLHRWRDRKSSASSLKLPQVRSALLVLLQHSCVYARSTRTEAAALKRPVYRVDVQAVLFRLRHPECVKHIQSRYRHDNIKEAIIESLLVNGRLRHDQITGAVLELLSDASSSISARQVQQALRDLVAAHYVEQAPPCGLPELPCPTHPNAQPKKTTKKTDPEKEKEEAEQVRIINLSHDSRYMPPDFDQTSAAPYSQVHAGQKRKWGADNPDTPAHTGLWQVSRNEFVRQFRHAACAQFIGEHHGSGAQAVARGILSASQPAWTGEAHAERTSRPVTQSQVVDAIRWLPAAADLSEADIATLYRQLQRSTDGFVVAAQDGGGCYVNLERTVAAMQESEVESHLQSRFGTLGLRIWRMLRLRKQLEESAIAESALVAPKEARVVLYSLLNSGFVSMQDIPKGSDRAASRMFWTWRAHLPDAVRLLSQHLLKGVLNLRLRLDHEHATVEQAALAFAEGHHLPASQREALQRFKDIQTGCHGRVLRLLPLLFLFLFY